MGRGESCTTTGVRRTVAGPFQLGASAWEQVWLRGCVKAQNLGPGHPQTCSTHSLPHLTDTLGNSLLPAARTPQPPWAPPSECSQ